MVGRILKAIIFLPVTFLLAGCATLYNPATGKNEAIFINSKTESAIGQGAVAELAKKYRISTDSVLLGRAAQVGRRVSSVSDRQDIGYKFSVLEDKELNAFTLPGGFVYINEGLIKILNDDELAYVLGHEVGHVAARHIAKKLQTNMTYQLLLGIAFVGLGAGGNSPAAQGAAQGVDTIYGLVGLGYSRQDEYQADALGVKYAYKAGFNPNAAISALEKIKEKGGNPKLLVYLRSRPYTEDRIKAIKPIIAQMISKNAG